MTKQITEDEFNRYTGRLDHATAHCYPMGPVLRSIITDLGVEITHPREWKDGDVAHSKNGVAWYLRRSGTWHEIAYPPRTDRYRKYTDEQISQFISDGLLKEWIPR